MQRSLKYLAAILAATVLLSACGGGGSAASDSPVSSNQPESPSGGRPESPAGSSPQGGDTATVAGADANANGIRDDIDALIASDYAQNAKLKSAVEATARLLQTTLTREAWTASDASKLENESIRATVCASETMDDAATDALYRATLKLYAQTFNTEERMAKRRAYVAAMPLEALETKVQDCAPATRLSETAPQAPHYSAEVCKTVPDAFYINGINKPLFSLVALDARRLESAMRGRNINFTRVEPLYNPSEGILLDIVKELLSQKILESVVERSKLVNDALETLFGVSDRLSASDRELVQAKFAEKVIAGYSGSSASEVLERFYGRVKGATDSGSAVVVAHSQGNMFANQLYDTLVARHAADTTLRDRIRVVNVGNPAGRAPHAMSTTAHEDQVINHAARILSLLGGIQPLAPNVWLAPASWVDVDITGHGFHEIYMNPTFEARNKILTDVAASANAVVASPASTQPVIELTASGDAGWYEEQYNGTTYLAFRPTLMSRRCADLRYFLGTHHFTGRASGAGQPTFTAAVQLSILGSAQGQLPRTLVDIGQFDGNLVNYVDFDAADVTISALEYGYRIEVDGGARVVPSLNPPLAPSRLR